MKDDQMFRNLSLAVVCLTLIPASVTFAQKKPFKNKIAIGAKKDFNEAIAKAKKEYSEKLDLAIKEAGGAGDLEEANRLVAEKKEFGSAVSPLEKARKQIEGTRWGTSTKSTINFLSNRKVDFGGKYSGIWIMSGQQTLLLQSGKSKTITVWQFNTKLTSAQYYTFNPHFPDDFLRFGT